MSIAATQPAAATSSHVSPSIPRGWTAHAPIPPAAALNILRGTPDGSGGCIFSLSGTSQPGQYGQDTVEVASDASACQVETATTVISAPPVDRTPQSANSKSGSGKPTATNSSRLSPDTYYGPVTATIRTLFHDPADITLTEVKNSTTWQYNYACAIGRNGSYYYHWDAYTGWSLESNNWQNTTSCGQTTSSSYAHFHNRPFCFFSATDTYFNRTTIHGLPNGGYSWSYYYRATGNCVDLLTFEHSEYWG